MSQPCVTMSKKGCACGETLVTVYIFIILKAKGGYCKIRKTKFILSSG